jgi:hypothetical protein
MKLSKTIRFTVRVRDYESVHIEVGAEASHYDLGIDDQLLATFDGPQIDRRWDSLQRMVEDEVDRLARQELETVSELSEILPNLANDYLDAKEQEDQHARNHQQKSATPAPASRRVRRGGSPSTTPPAA